MTRPGESNPFKANLQRLRSAVGSVGYLLQSRPFALEKPVVLQFPVIDICNSACRMCRIWENKASEIITPEQLRQGLRNPLYSEVVSVGLNGGEPTLRKDLAALGAVLFEELPQLRFVSLITNAYNFQDVCERITELGEVVLSHKGYFDVMVSLDGYGEVHDRVRGRPGSFERAEKVIDFALASALVHNVRIGCTIIKDNVYGLPDLLEYCLSRGVYVKFRLGVPHQRLYTEGLTEPYALSAGEKYHVAEFIEGLISHYESGEMQNVFYRSLVDQMVHGSSRRAGCDWQHRGASINSKGVLLYCALHSKELGSIHENDSRDLYFANEPHLRQIVATKCDSCSHDYSGRPPKKLYLRHLVGRVLKKAGVEEAVPRFKDSVLWSWLLERRFAARRSAFKAIALERHGLVEAHGGVRVLICGWYGTETLGDKAILGGVVHAIQLALGEVQFTLVSLNSYISEMTRHQMPELAGAEIVEAKEGIRLARGADLVVFGGGPLMASIDQLAEMEAIFSAAGKHGVPTLVAGCGVGPLGNRSHNDSIARILAMATLRVYRDAKSREVAASLGVETAGDVVAEDPAFTWLKIQRGRLQSRPPVGQKVLLLGLRDFPHLQYAGHIGKAESLTAKRHFEDELVSALEELAAQHADLLIRPLPMCTNHFGDDDRWFYRRLFRGNERLKGRLDLSLLGPELAPVAYCEAFRGAHVVLAMRFHSLVFALGLGVPAIAVDYTLGKGKVRSLAERFGVPFQSLADLDAQFLIRGVNGFLQAPTAQAEDFDPRFSDELITRLPRLVGR